MGKLKNYTENEAIKILYNSAQAYQKYLVDKSFLIIYKKENTYYHTSVSFNKQNFRHLSGIITDYHAGNFYKLCMDKRLPPSSISFKRDGNTNRKLMILPAMTEMFCHKCWIGTTIHNDISIESDYFVGDTRCVLSVGFRYGENNTDYPVTLLYRSLRESVETPYKVYAILVKNRGEKLYKSDINYYIDADFNIVECRNQDFYQLINGF